MSDWKNLPPLFERAALHCTAVERADHSAEEQPWCVAFSGGADSLALLLTIWQLWPGRRKNLVALHFNHGLRGAESDADEQFCREVCGSLGVTFSSATWSGRPDRPGEAEARDARQAFFTNEMRTRGAAVLWTGHQKDDVAETQLMRLARGSGPAGLAAPRPVSEKSDGRLFLRPLLTLTKGEIMAALTAQGLRWREDATNVTRDYFRTRVRHDVLPRLQDAACNNVLGGAALTRELCQEDDEALGFWLRQLDLPMAKETLDLRRLEGFPRALWRRALRQWEAASTLSRQGFEELLVLCEQGKEGRVSAGIGFIEIDEGTLTWTKEHARDEEWPAEALRQGAVLALRDGAQIAAKEMALASETVAGILAGAVDCATSAYIAGCGLPLQVRNWRKGDRFRPLGAPGSAKLQDLFVNRKIPVEVRSRLPVICSEEGDIVWVPGFPPAEHAKITAKTVLAVQLTYRYGTSTLTL